MQSIRRDSDLSSESVLPMCSIGTQSCFEETLLNEAFRSILDAPEPFSMPSTQSTPKRCAAKFEDAVLGHFGIGNRILI